MELLENQMKQYNWEQDQIAHMKVFSLLMILYINNIHISNIHNILGRYVFFINLLLSSCVNIECRKKIALK